jgi:hypothetical protein
MAVAFDATSESHTGTTGSTSEASFSWTHTPVGTPAGVVVYVMTDGTATDLVTSVTYGGTAMAAVSGGLAADTAGEVGQCKAYFLGASIPTGAQTVVVNRTNTADTMYAIAISVTAGADTEYTGVLIEQEDQAVAEESIDDGSPGTDSVRMCGIFTGRAIVPGVGANSTLAHGIDLGALAMAACYETTAGQGSRPVGFSIPAEDTAAVYLAVRELASGTILPQMLQQGLYAGSAA